MNKSPFILIIKILQSEISLSFLKTIYQRNLYLYVKILKGKINTRNNLNFKIG